MSCGVVDWLIDKSDSPRTFYAIISSKYLIRIHRSQDYENVIYFKLIIDFRWTYISNS